MNRGSIYDFDMKCYGFNLYVYSDTTVNCNFMVKVFSCCIKLRTTQIISHFYPQF